MIRTTLARTPLLILCLAVSSSALWAQNQNRGTLRGIPGYLDPLTGQFRTMIPPAQQEQDAEAPPATISGGKLVFNFTITVSSTVASTSKIFCEADALVSDSNGTYEESAAVSVTRGTGSTVSCTVTIPYSWALNTASSDLLSMSYSIGVVPTTASVLSQRTSTHSFPPAKVPANGATTTTPVTATI